MARARRRQRPPVLYVRVEIVGPAGIAFDRGTIYLAIGGPGPATALVPETYLQNSVVAIDPSNGDIKTIADVGAYERSTTRTPMQSTAISTGWPPQAAGSSTSPMPAGTPSTELVP